MSDIVQRQQGYPIRLQGEGGQVLEGVFVFRAIEPEDEATISIRRANLAHGAAWDSLDPLARYNFESIATLLTACVEAPGWYPLNPAGMLGWDPTVNSLLAAEARKHSDRYFRQHAGASVVEAFRRGLAGRVVVARTGD